MYLCIDIGGTKTLIALFSRRGRVLRRRKFRTPQGSTTFLTELERNLSEFKKRRIRCVVVAAPGVVQKNYTVHFGNRNWGDFDLLSTLNRLFACPIKIQNDANLAALYEGYRLHGKTVFLTFSTGIGGGVVEHNRILPESDGFEPGHKMYFYDGRVQEWEDIAAASAIENYYHVDKATDLRKKDVMTDVAKRVSLGLPEIVKKYKPDNIVLGGPMGKVFNLYSKYLPDLGVKYRRPRRPNESVIYGAYLYARQKERE